MNYLTSKRLLIKDSDNLFSIFNLPISFEIDRDLLDSRYRDLQMIYHPDKFIEKSIEERNIVISISSNLNMAYRTLTDPLSRAQLLMKVMNWTDKDEDKVLDSETILEEVIEWMERIRELKKNKDWKNDSFLDERRKDYEKTVNRLGCAFKKRNQELAKKEIVRLLYLRRILSS